MIPPRSVDNPNSQFHEVGNYEASAVVTLLGGLQYRLSKNFSYSDYSSVLSYVQHRDTFSCIRNTTNRVTNVVFVALRRHADDLRRHADERLHDVHGHQEDGATVAPVRVNPSSRYEGSVRIR